MTIVACLSALAALLVPCEAAMLLSKAGSEAVGRRSLDADAVEEETFFDVKVNGTMLVVDAMPAEHLVMLPRPYFESIYMQPEYDFMMKLPGIVLDNGHDCVHGWDITNPSLMLSNHTVLAAFRASCVVIETASSRRWYSKLLFGQATTAMLHDARFEWTAFGEAGDPRFNEHDPLMQECLIDHRDYSQGPEDPKLLKVNGKSYVVVTGLDTMHTREVPPTEDDRPSCRRNGLHGFLMHLYEVTSHVPMTYGEGVKLLLPGMGMIEKNWGFFTHYHAESGEGADEALMAVYKIHPHTIVDVSLETGAVSISYQTTSPLLADLAHVIAMDTQDFHGGAGIARVTEAAVPGVIVWELHTEQCLKAEQNRSGSPVRLTLCNPDDHRFYWEIDRSPGYVRLHTNPDLCMDTTSENLALSPCMPYGSDLQQRLALEHSRGFGFLQNASGHCLSGIFEGERAGNLSMMLCGEGQGEVQRKMRRFQFQGATKRDYYLSIVHARPLGAGLPYRNWPYRFSAQPPFEILEVGKELTPFLLTMENPSYGIPVQFITSVVHDKSDENSNIVLGYGSGDATSRLFRMSLDSFEGTFFGDNNASHWPDAFNGAAAEIQRQRKGVLHERMRLRNELRQRYHKGRGQGASAHPDHDSLRRISKMKLTSHEMAEMDDGLGDAEDVLGGGGGSAGGLFWPAAPVANRWREKVDDAGAGSSAGDQRSTRLISHSERDGAEANMCLDGWLIPELVVLGAQSNFSTRLVNDLSLSPEMHIGTQGTTPLSDGSSKVAKLSTLRCPSSGRKVIVRCTSNSPHQPADVRLVASAVRGTVFQSSVVFLVLLRDPVRRMQAAYVNYHRWATCDLPLPPTFRELVEPLILPGAPCDCVCTQTLPITGHGRALHDSFGLFDSKQFKVAPFKYAVGALFPTFVWELMGVQPGASGSAPSTPRYEQLEPLSTALGDNLTSQLRAFFHQMDGNFQLTRVLAGSHAELYGYRGLREDQDAITVWISEGFQE